MSKLAYTIPEAADEVSVSVATIRRAINATDPAAFPPPLQAKNMGTPSKPSYRIKHTVLEAWFDSLQDA